MTTTQRRRVSWSNLQDFDCALLGSLGFSTKFLVSKTGLTQHQVTYRLHKANVSRMAFRNGESPEALALLRRHRSVAEGVLRSRLPRTHFVGPKHQGAA